MISKVSLASAAACLFGLAAAVPAPALAERQAVSVATTKDSSVTFIYQNNLNATDDANHIGALLLDDYNQASAQGACAAFGESLLTKAAIQAHQSDFLQSLSYLALINTVKPVQLYYIAGGVIAVAENVGTLTFSPFPAGNLKLPVLCTQSSQENGVSNARASATNQIAVTSNGNTYIGFRNKKSFRYLGIPYADPPQRWVYSTPYSKTGQTLNTTVYGAQCAQGTGSENCLFLNIQTPYIPKANSKSKCALKPVHFWIHGGGFTGGTGADAGSDGGNLASREDIVTVTVNYRLSTLGFLAIPGTNITGNYGIQDQINALQWTIKNIAAFGGDPNNIVINGESAGAGSVRTLLGSPPAIGKFQGAIAMSNLGGGVTLGLSGDYGTTYSDYYTIQQSYNVAGQNIFKAANCTQATLDEQIACLKTVDANKLVGLNAVARYVVQDGTYVVTPRLEVTSRNKNVAFVPVIFGVTANDGASFSTYPKTPVTTELQGLMTGLGINAYYAQAVIDSGLFPLYDTGNLTADAFNVTQRIATDKTFRCVDQATVYAGAKTNAFKKAYFYQMERTISGYNPNNVDASGPITPGYPRGNPNLPYYRVHGSDMPWVFGNLGSLRDANDLYSIQLESGYFAQFVKTQNPNPSTAYLKTRGYSTSLKAVQQTGPWNQVSSETGPIRLMDYPATQGTFVDLPQCAWLNYSINYYLSGK